MQLFHISTNLETTFLTESNDLSSIQDIQGKGLAGLIKPVLNQGEIFIISLII